MAGEGERPDIAQAKARMSSKLGARREFHALPKHLREGETVDRIATWIDSGATTGILVATSRRLLCLRSKRASDIVDDFPYEKVSSIQWTAGMVHGTMTVFVSGAPSEFERVDKHDGEAVVGLVRSRASGTPGPTLAHDLDAAPAAQAHSGSSGSDADPVAEKFEYKTVKVPTTGTTFTSHKRDRILNKYAKQGWEVDQYATPGRFGRKDTVVLRRKAR